MGLDVFSSAFYILFSAYIWPSLMGWAMVGCLEGRRTGSIVDAMHMAGHVVAVNIYVLRLLASRN